MVAAEANNSKITDVFVMAGADLNIADSDGGTALMFAAEQGHSDIVKALLIGEANLNATDSDGDTALMYAVVESHSEVAKMLIAAGANPDLTNEVGKTAWNYIEDKPVMLAVMKKAVSEKYGVDISSPTKSANVAEAFLTIWRSVVVVRTDNGQCGSLSLGWVATNNHVVENEDDGDIVIVKPNNRQATTSTRRRLFATAMAKMIFACWLLTAYKAFPQTFGLTR